jgi:hypothetical protein
MPPFIVLALPRSRTAWLSRFLTYGEWTCGHEELRNMRSLADVQSWLSQPCVGTIETAAAGSWRLLGKLAPNARIVLIRRNREEVIESLMSVPGITFDRPSLAKGMVALDRKLDQIEARLPCLSVDYRDLANEVTCASIFEYCLPYKHDTEHWQHLAPINIQMDMRAMVKQITAFRPQMDKLAAVAKHRMLTDMAVREPILPDGVTIQTEGFESWLKDAKSLFSEHLVQVGEAPGDWQSKNIPLMRVLDRAGLMQVTTARSNGRMFGYLMTLISPSLRSADVTSATNTTFFASQDVPGLGMKLQRAALRALKARGVDEVFMQAGIRGSGPRLDTIFRRLGAENDGQVFRLALSEA